MVTISNTYLTASFLSKGAELCSLKHKDIGTEYIWQAGDEWPKHSPILFPIVGALKEGIYNHKGKSYAMNRHGFARDMAFDIIETTDNSVTFRLISSEQTRSYYPFEFDFIIKYVLDGLSLTVMYEVENIGVEEMYFSVGAHPAFNVPLEPHLEFDDYQLLIELSDSVALPIDRFPLDSQGLTLLNGEHYIVSNPFTLPLHKELFINDALVFKHMPDASVTIFSNKSNRMVKVAYQGFPYLGIWNKYGANFLCIEPWNGITDNVNANGEIDNKEGIIKLAPSTTWVAKWSLSVL